MMKSSFSISQQSQASSSYHQKNEINKKEITKKSLQKGWVVIEGGCLTCNTVNTSLIRHQVLCNSCGIKLYKQKVASPFIGNLSKFQQLVNVAGLARIHLKQAKD